MSRKGIQSLSAHTPDSTSLSLSSVIPTSDFVPGLSPPHSSGHLSSLLALLVCVPLETEHEITIAV
jgi:hypothetical protein